jgi:hypothetical protein
MPHVPMGVWIPISLNDPAASVPVPAELEIISVVGSLQALTSGPFVARVRDGSGNIVALLTWGGPGVQSVDPITSRVDDSLNFDITDMGTGAAGCYITVWYNPSSTQVASAVATGNQVMEFWTYMGG